MTCQPSSRLRFVCHVFYVQGIVGTVAIIVPPGLVSPQSFRDGLIFPSCKTSEIKTAWVPSAVHARSAPVTSRPRVDSVGERASAQLCHLGTCPPAPASWLRQDALLSGKHPHSSLGVCGLCETTSSASGGHVATCWLEHRCWFKTTGLLGARR